MQKQICPTQIYKQHHAGGGCNTMLLVRVKVCLFCFVLARHMTVYKITSNYKTMKPNNKASVLSFKGLEATTDYGVCCGVIMMAHS